MFTFSKKVLLSLALVSVLGSGVFGYLEYQIAFAQTTDDTTARQQQLQSQLDEIEKQIAAQQQILDQKKTEGSSISRDISILDAQIKKAQLEIQAHALAIQRLGKDIGTKQETIVSLSQQIDQEKVSLGAVIERTNELDTYTLANVLLSNNKLSDFFVDIGDYSALQASLQQLFGQVQTAKAQTEVEKNTLDQQRNQEIDLKINVEDEKTKIQQAEAQKQTLLSLNKQQQKDYQGIISDKQKQARAIEDALFALRDTSAIKFSTALQYANQASAKTGVRPAFLLAILTQETNLGANIGSCYLTGDSDGSGIKIKSGAAVQDVMKASRDVPIFLSLMSQLGRDPHHTPISCPQGIGYGGGMGPSQFIASTWQLLEPSIAAATGKSVPDPFNPADAFMASAVYLSNLGAGAGGYTAERNAACKYYSGKSCTTQTYNGFYGDSVVKIATNIQNNIDILQNN